MTQTVTSQQPSFATNVINGFPAIQFDNVSNTNDKLIGPDSPLLDNTTGYTFIMVTRPQNVDGNARAVLSKRTGVAINQSFMHFFFSGSTFYTDIQTNNNRYNTSTTFAANNNYLITQMFDGSLVSTSRCRTYIAGALDITASETSSLVPDNSSPLVIGSTDEGDGRPYGGYIPELIIFRTALNDAQRIITDNYISSKYNIPLAANDKYLGDTPANGDYDWKVCGVGMESSGSSTSFSPSVSGGFGISVNSGLDNGDYILAGHKVSNNSSINTDVGGMSGLFNSRWQRVWYVDVTNTSANINVDVEFDMSDGDMQTFAFGLLSNYVLLYRSGQTGNWTEVATANTLTGDRVVFSGQTLVDGYYTIGTRNFLLSPLPVELLDLSATFSDGSVKVSWTTATEKDSKGFRVERSIDGGLFEETGNVAAAGNSVTKKSYEFIDGSPPEGTIYYRLKEISLSRQVNYSYPVAVTVHGTDHLKIYPNPATSEIYLQFASKLSERASGKIINSSGVVCAEFILEPKQSNVYELPLALPAGLYQLIIHFINRPHSHKFTIR